MTILDGVPGHNIKIWGANGPELKRNTSHDIELGARIVLAISLLDLRGPINNFCHLAYNFNKSKY